MAHRPSQRLPYDPARSHESIRTENAQNASVDRPQPNIPSPPLTQPNPRPSIPPSQPSSIARPPTIDTEAFPPDQECPVPQDIRDPMEPRTGNSRDRAWEKDGSVHRPSSYELLLQWLEIPGNPQRYRSGIEGMTQVEATRRCSIWLQQRGAPTFRRQHACLLKLNILYRGWENANEYMQGTGLGQGAREIADAEESGDRSRITAAYEKVEQKCLELCPEWLRLKEVFNEAAGGNAALRSDTTQDNQPILRRLQRPIRESSRNDRHRRETTDPDDSEAGNASGTERNSPVGGSGRIARGNTQEGRGGRGEGGGRVPRSLADDEDRPRQRRKKRARSNSFEKKLLKNEDRYRQKKLEKMDESNHVTKKLAAAQGTEAIASTAATIQGANASWSWRRCVAEAKRMMEGFDHDSSEEEVEGEGEGSVTEGDDLA